jgi:hypothetical protein
MIKISIDQPTYQALKNDIMMFVNRYIEVEPQKDPAHLNSETLQAAPPSIHQRVDLGGYTEAFPDSKGHVQPRTSGYPPAPQKVPTPIMAIPRIPTQQSASTTTHNPLDSVGQPWNPEIHSSSKNFNKDGTWRIKRNLDPAVLAAAKAGAQGPTRTRTEIVARMEEAAIPFQAPPVPFVPAAAPINTAPLAQPAAIQPTTETVIRGNDIYSVPNAQGVHAHTLLTFKENLVPIFASLVTEGRINQEYIDQLKNYFGIKELWDLWKDEKKVSELFENFCGANLIQRIEG